MIVPCGGCHKMNSNTSRMCWWSCKLVFWYIKIVYKTWEMRDRIKTHQMMVLRWTCVSGRGVSITRTSLKQVFAWEEEIDRSSIARIYYTNRECAMETMCVPWVNRQVKRVRWQAVSGDEAPHTQRLITLFPRTICVNANACLCFLAQWLRNSMQRASRHLFNTANTSYAWRRRLFICELNCFFFCARVYAHSWIFGSVWEWTLCKASDG